MIEDQIRKLIKPAILEAKAYHVPKSDGLIKLDAMENPYIWTDELKSSWAEYMQKAELNRYPDASTSELREKLSAMFDLPEGIEMLFGNGSDELIQINDLVSGTLFSLINPKGQPKSELKTRLNRRFLEIFKLSEKGIEDGEIGSNITLKTLKL